LEDLGKNQRIDKMKKINKESINRVKEEKLKLNEKTRRELMRAEQNPKFISHKGVLEIIKRK